MKLRFASWNINNQLPHSGLLDLIGKIDPDVLALQEVNPKFHSELSKMGVYDWAASSLSLRPPLMSDPLYKKRGCSLFGRPPFVLSALSVLEIPEYADQTLVVEIHSPGGALTACSFHTPPGSNPKHGNKKGEFLKSIAEWLAPRESRTIFGIDANTPKIERLDIEKNVWWRRKYEPLLLGGPCQRLHKLRDSYREYLEENQELKRKVPEEGPLAKSYVRRGKGGKEIGCRYDFIYATPDIRVRCAQYRYDESRAAGSDHALVFADLELPVKNLG
jgi:exonuclease III